MSKKQLTIGLDIGGTKMLGILYDGEKVLADFKLATPKDSVDHFLVMVKALVEPLFDKAKELKTEVKGIGVSIAGAIDFKNNIAFSPNIKILEGLNLAKKLGDTFKFPISIDNDANCFVRAEAKKGAGIKYENIYGLIIGTGVGGGWFENGEVYQNKYGGDGEPGAMIIDFPANTVLEPAYHKLAQNNPENLAEEAYRGDILAEKTFIEIGEMLGKALANISNLIGPEVFILGGSVVKSSDLFLPNLKKTLRENIVSPELKKRTKVLKSKLGDKAGAIGAALLIE